MDFATNMKVEIKILQEDPKNQHNSLEEKTDS